MDTSCALTGERRAQLADANVQTASVHNPDVGASMSAGQPAAKAIHVHETDGGNWLVHDASNSRGGIFRTLKVAMAFVRQTFGRDAAVSVSSLIHDPSVPNPPSSAPQVSTPRRRMKMLRAKYKAVAAGSTIFERCESQVRSYGRAFPQTFERALGSALWDASGKRYLDFLAGAGSLNYGHNNPVLKEALIKYIFDDGIAHSLDLHTVAKEKFLEAFQDIIMVPRGQDYVLQFTGPTGTNAVEAALKLARKVTGRTGVISFTNAFHGVSLGSLALAGNQYFRRAAGVPLSGAVTMPYDGYFGAAVDTVAMLEKLLADPSSGLDEPAAVILETVQGEGGLNCARVDWLKRLESLCNTRGIVFIVDDIQAGCGRTGTFFSFEEAGLKPDIVTLSKSISGFGLPMSVVLIKRALDVWKPAEHNGTFRGNNHAFITAAAALRHYWSTPDFAAGVVQRSEHLKKRLEAFAATYPDHIEQVRGRGMMRGLSCYDPEAAAKVTAEAFKQGLIIERAGPADEVIKFLMPLTTELAEMDEGLEILGQAMEQVFKKTALKHKRPNGHAADHTNGAGLPIAAFTF